MGIHILKSRILRKPGQKTTRFTKKEEMNNKWYQLVVQNQIICVDTKSMRLIPYISTPLGYIYVGYLIKSITSATYKSTYAPLITLPWTHVL